ncbi:ATP-binding protein [Streptomyces sp. NPDC003077]|uniref:ATP-binding protein n=1 Tax=Streptomyces sp. NPDC003077 TaxID=3154443 RepID=UPI0033A9F6CC
MSPAPSAPLLRPPAVRRPYALRAPRDAVAPKLMRAWVCVLLVATGHRHHIDDARLLVAELVTNVVRHTRAPRVEVTVVVEPTSVRVSVWDNSPGWPRVREAALEDGGGRGLLLVAALASDWGVTRSAGRSCRKSVWVVLGDGSGTACPDDGSGTG